MKQNPETYCKLELNESEFKNIKSLVDKKESILTSIYISMWVVFAFDVLSLLQRDAMRRLFTKPYVLEILAIINIIMLIIFAIFYHYRYPIKESFRAWRSLQRKFRQIENKD